MGKLNKKQKQNIGYVGKFYRNLALDIDKARNWDFCVETANDAEIPSEDVQKYLLVTSDFAKGMNDDINLYITPNTSTMRVLDKTRSDSQKYLS